MGNRKNSILIKFIKEHQQLIKLGAEITIDEFTESINSEEIKVFDKPLLHINIKHPFIFDNRLIPADYKGIKVNNIVVGEYPKEFPEPIDSMPLHEYESPEKYELFVANNLELIRHNLNAPQMNSIEALEALTGNYTKHKEWYERTKEEFFNNYLWLMVHGEKK
ncbi:MAG: hypothetical protein A3F72_03705 [Bacteroidetes bacterium RIFCSPLOWO2_12_FULL_35_15]|nr:MAG: hypothetical protein A3F72_03705 [Bacteroidetes bacterium RIFCSPLOWO2_12_FULL_35_15]